MNNQSQRTFQFSKKLFLHWHHSENTRQVTLREYSQATLNVTFRSVGNGSPAQQVLLNLLVQIRRIVVSLLPLDFNKKSADNMILSVLLKYKAENPILLTSDNGLQIKAKGIGLTTISLKEFLRK